MARSTETEDTAAAAETEETAAADTLHLLFPHCDKQFSSDTRTAFRSNDTDGKFVVKGKTDEQSSSRIIARLFNGPSRSNPNFKRKFNAAFQKWTAKQDPNSKKSRSSALVSEYSRFLSTVMTGMKKEWSEVTPAEELDDAVDFWDIFIHLTKRTYQRETRNLMLRPTPSNSMTHIATQAAASAKFKAAYKVSAA